mgnify:CR=1 FL=1
MLTGTTIAIAIGAIIVLALLVIVIFYLYQESERSQNNVVPPANNNCTRSTDTIPNISNVAECFNSTGTKIPYRNVDGKTIGLASGAILTNVSTVYVDACRGYCKGNVVNQQCLGDNKPEYDDCLKLTKPVDNCTGGSMPVAFAEDTAGLSYWYLYSVPPGLCAPPSPSQ